MATKTRRKNHASNRKSEPRWKTKWPRNGDLAAWFRCMLHKCEAIEDEVTAAKESRLPIEHLARMGYEAEAIRWVNRFLKRLSPKQVLPTVWLSLLGAKISLDAGNTRRMEKYLAIAESTEPFNTRKCDKGFSVDAVRKWQAENGILNPDDAVDEAQRVEAIFWGAKRRFDLALKDSKEEAARLAVAEMEQVAGEHERPTRRELDWYLVLRAFADLNDSAAVKRLIRRLSPQDRDQVLDARTLIRLGMTKQAIARAKRDIEKELEELATMTDPNIHFPAMSICRSLQILVELGEKNSAKRWLRRALKDMPTWPAIEYGWTTSAVYHSFAGALALIEGPAAAEQMLEQAMEDGKIEKRAGFRKAAINDALDLKADIGRLDEAIAEARKLRSPTQRRKELGKLLAKAGRWKELREVLSQVASPEEARDVAWWIKFELPGGEVRRD